MFRKSQDMQITLNDRMLTANEQTRTAVDSSRAKLVGDVLYPNINEERFAALFSDRGSRPNIEIRKYICFMVLERMYKQPESIALEFLRCGALNYQYALHTTQDEKQPLSENSLRRFRRAVEDYNKAHGCDLIKEEFERISKQIGVSMGVLPDPEDSSDAPKQTILIRMDSMEIEAHARVMTRLEILYTSVMIVLRYFVKMDQDYLIPKALMHYLEKDDRNNTLYYRASEDVKSEIRHKRITAVIEEMVLLHDIITLNFMPRFISSVPELSVFERVYGEQLFWMTMVPAFRGTNMTYPLTASRIRLMKPSRTGTSAAPPRKRLKCCRGT